MGCTAAQRPGCRHLSCYAIAVTLNALVVELVGLPLKTEPVRRMACYVTASLRARATLAFRGPVLWAIAWAQSRRRDPPRFLQ